MRDDEILAAGLADHPRVAAIARDVVADGAPQLLEHRRRAGEVDAREVAGAAPRPATPRLRSRSPC